MSTCARAWRLKSLAGGLALLAALGPGAAAASARGAQQDPELRAVVQQAIAQAQCFDDQYDSAVWYTLMEPRLRGYLANHRDRLAVLRTVYCETHRANATPLPPGLVLAVLDVESHFNRLSLIHI